MKFIRSWLLLLGALLLLAVAACSSSPPPEEPVAPAPAPAPESPPPPAPEPAPAQADPREALMASLNELLARLDAARNGAYAFDGPVYFKSETDDAEAAYVSAGAEAETGTPEQIEEAIARYTQVTEAFEKIFADSVPLYAEDRIRELIAARDAASQAGAPELTPERFQSAEDDTENARQLYEEEKDYYGAASAVSLAINKYKALDIGTRAYYTREQIEYYNFERYDPENFAHTDDRAVTAIDAYDNGDLDTALDAAEECLVRYTVILGAGMRAYAAERRDAADGERRFSIEMKANIAVKDDFAAAQGVFDSAERAFQGEQYIEAARLYFQAEFAFAEAGAAAEQKRLLAEDAIKRAEASTAASENTARNAEGL
ncbi:MAG: hypothetical protein LBH15_04040 [Treponema sp.]|jgi:hypothetical protein|nr:hypothetical protein [Treponema sp.]